MPSARTRDFLPRSHARIIVLSSCFVLILLCVRQGNSASLGQKQSLAPQFEDYPAGRIFAGKPPRVDVPPDFPQQEFFQLSIKDLVDGGVNFAGHYAVREWSCGTNCHWLLVLDMKTGEFLRDSPYGTLSLTKEQTVRKQHDCLQFRADSRLLIATGCFDAEDPANPAECGTKYSKLEKEKFVLIRYDPKSAPAHVE
jgi:hypothetical protein